MIIHLVCNGNTFRSRLAEAYLKQQLEKLNISSIEISSSGTRAEDNHQGPIAWYALKIIVKEDLVPYMANVWTQTTQDLLDVADAVVFMHSTVLDNAKEWTDADAENYKVWDIADISSEDIKSNTRGSDEFDMEVIHTTEAIFEKIKVAADSLIKDIQMIMK